MILMYIHTYFAHSTATASSSYQKQREAHMCWYSKLSGESWSVRGSDLLPVSMCLRGSTLQSYPWEKPSYFKAASAVRSRPLSFSHCSTGGREVFAALLCLWKSSPWYGTDFGSRLQLMLFCGDLHSHSTVGPGKQTSWLHPQGHEWEISHPTAWFASINQIFWTCKPRITHEQSLKNTYSSAQPGVNGSPRLRLLSSASRH